MMQAHDGLLRMDQSAPLALPTSGSAQPDVFLNKKGRLSLSCNSEGEFYPDIDLEVLII